MGFCLKFTLKDKEVVSIVGFLLYKKQQQQQKKKRKQNKKQNKCKNKLFSQNGNFLSFRYLVPYFFIKHIKEENKWKNK